MTLIKQYVQAMLNQDSVALSKLFSPTAIFVDYCPKDAGQPQLHAYGPEGIDMFFRNRFLFRRFEITDPLIVSDTQAYYYAVYNGYHIRAVATIQDFSEDGEIQRLVVRPALAQHTRPHWEASPSQWGLFFLFLHGISSHLAHFPLIFLSILHNFSSLFSFSLFFSF